MYMMLMNKIIPDEFNDTIYEKIVKNFIMDNENKFGKNEKAKIGTILTSLISMRYRSKNNIREYTMKMSHLA